MIGLTLALTIVTAGSGVPGFRSSEVRVLFAQNQNPGTPVDLSAAKSLYASGDYEEALKKLPTDLNADEADQYRALCLLALGKTDDAQRVIEGLVTRRPLFKMSEGDVSPRLLTMFHDARKRVLPAAVRALYAKAREDFDQKNFTAAAAGLKDLMPLFGDDDLGAAAASLADLKLVAEGFLKLTDTELANLERANAEMAAAQRRALAEANRAYSADDKDVKPPIEVSREMPEWRPSTTAVNRPEYRGILRIVIDERGKVESATIIQSVLASYDPLLVEAAKQWLYRPALRNGQAVKYVKLIAISLSSR